MMDDIQRFDVVEATFAPVRRDDLKPEAEAALGMRGRWMAAWRQEPGDAYAGQWAMMPMHEFWDAGCKVGWVPLCDLADVRKVPLTARRDGPNRVPTASTEVVS